MAEAPQGPSRPNPFSVLRRRLQAFRSSPKPEVQTSTEEIDLTKRVLTGEQKISLGNAVFVVRVFPDAVGSEPKYFVTEINPGRSLGGAVKVVDSDGREKVVQKETSSKRGGLPTYRIKFS